MLKELSLEALGESEEFKNLFQQSVNEVSFSFTENGDVPGDRKITITLTMKPKGNPAKGGYITTEMDCKPIVPRRIVAAVTTMDNQRINIDCVSGDARQPDLLEHAGANVRPITKHKEGAAS